jgi:general secretion pathway protein K
MLIVTLVATLSAGMVWQQWKGIEVETAERARAQAAWLIEGATDWARLILRTDAQDRERPNVDTLNEPWNTPLKDVKLSDFLAADKNNTADTGLEAFLSGQITDAQSRYNLRNLLNDEEADAVKELATLRRLCEALGIPPEAANRIADGMKGADLAEDQLDDEEAVSPGAPLPPQRVQQLTWFGLDNDAVRRLSPYVIILPARPGEPDDRAARGERRADGWTAQRRALAEAPGLTLDRDPAAAAAREKVHTQPIHQPRRRRLESLRSSASAP